MNMQKKNIKIIGEDIIDKGAINQLLNCTGTEDYGVLTADAHIGYGHPIGGAIAYKNHISLSGVGFDIACGNKAVRTTVHITDIKIGKVMDQIVKDISFGIGRKNNEKVDHPVIDQINDLEIPCSKKHKQKLTLLAKEQLGTVGSGNHFVDLFSDEEGLLWIGVHFGSRGFGHKITTGFIAMSQGLEFGMHAKEKGMHSDPILFEVDSEIGQVYLECLKVAGAYAYAGRDWVVDKVLEILGNPQKTYEVHNHHNFAWRENHFNTAYWVVRKGCTPAFPGQKSFIGSNMFDESVIVEGVEGEEAQSALYSTVHGAGRILSRRKAIGKIKYKKTHDGKRKATVIRPGAVDFKKTFKKAKALGIELRGGGADESPECYKDLQEVLAKHQDSVKLLYWLKPVGVAMVGSDIFDPYRD